MHFSLWKAEVTTCICSIHFLHPHAYSYLHAACAGLGSALLLYTSLASCYGFLKNLNFGLKFKSVSLWLKVA
jgi:hypothetical protein